MRDVLDANKEQEPHQGVRVVQPSWWNGKETGSRACSPGIAGTFAAMSPAGATVLSVVVDPVRLSAGIVDASIQFTQSRARKSPP